MGKEVQTPHCNDRAAELSPATRKAPSARSPKALTEPGGEGKKLAEVRGRPDWPFPRTPTSRNGASRWRGHCAAGGTGLRWDRTELA